MKIVHQHFNIKRFGVEGVLGSDADLLRLRTEFERTTIDDMRDQGYIVVLDMGSHWSTEYNLAKDQYSFKLSMYGTRVGKRRAAEWIAITNGQALSIPPTKSQPSSETAK